VNARPAVDYTLVVTVLDETGRICITSPENIGLLIWAEPEKAFADVHGSVRLLRELNADAKACAT
jgi:hypothetical protein